MASKFRRAIDVVKDNTSLSLALVSGSSDIYIAVLRATSHDPSPPNEQAISEFLFLASSSPVSAVRALSRRLSRTANWAVAVKSLSLISRAISDAGPDFRREALAANSGSRRRLLHLSDFRDNSGLSSPWDFTAFVRTFALYLDARLETCASGKLPRRPRRFPVSNLKPPLLVGRIEHWQRLLGRAIGTRLTGQARESRLLRHVFHAIVRESFDLYRDIADGISFLLEGFFHLPVNLCLETFQVSKAATKQFEELGEFYAGCKKMGIGRPSEYPTIRKLSASLLETLEGFLKDREGGGQMESQSKFVMEPVREEVQPESENWELALVESMNELSKKCGGERLNAMEVGASDQDSPRKKRAFLSGFQNPFLRASYDKNLMAVTPSPPILNASAPKNRPLISVNDRKLTAAARLSESLLPGDSGKHRKEILGEDKEEDPFEELANRDRPAFKSAAAVDFREKYYMKAQS